MKKFKYNSIYSSFYSMPETTLNIYGEQGWELVGFTYEPANERFHYVFKKEFSNDKELIQG